MREQKLHSNMREMGEGIALCVKNRLQRSALVLLYSAIDAAAWIACDDPKAKVGERFMGWVDQYLLKACSLPCTSADIYSARCGLVHKFTPDSDMTGKGAARLMTYAWGDRDADALQNVIVHHKMDNRYVCVQVEALADGWRRGMDLFIQELAADPARAARVFGRAGQYFDSDPATVELMDKAIARVANATAAKKE